MRQLCIFIVNVLTCVIFMVSQLHGLEPAHKKGTYPTEHIAWAKPSLEKPKKILFFDLYFAAGRYPKELDQRYPMEYEKVYYNNSSGVCTMLGGLEGESRAEELIRRNDWDAFVFWGCPPSDLFRNSQKCYLLVLSQVVRRGAGLVVVDASPDPKIFKEKNRIFLNPVPLFGDQFPAEFYKIGKGKGARLNRFDYDVINKYGFSYRRDQAVPYSEGWRDRYEMRLGDVWNVLAWSMNIQRKNPAFEIGDGKLRVSSPVAGKMDLFIRGEGERFSLLEGSPVAADESKTFPISSLLPGRYLIGAIVRDNRGNVISYGGICYRVNKPVQKIQQVQLTKDYGKTGEKITGKVRCTKPGKLVVRLRDPDRRILAEQILKDQEFSFDLKETMPPLITVEADLIADGKTVDRQYSYFRKTIQRNGQFDMMLWGTVENFVGSIDVRRRLYELGITELVSFAPTHVEVPMLYLPPSGGPLFIKEPRNNARCWMDQDFLTKRIAATQKSVRYTAQSGMKRVLLGDEGPVQLGCLSSSCQKCYNQFLRNKYRGDLKKLNDAWKTNYSSWDQVGLSMIPERHQGADLARYIKQIYTNTDAATLNHALNTWGIERPRDWNQVVEIWKRNPAARAYFNDQFLMQECGSMLAKNYRRWFDRCDYRSYAMAKALGAMDKGLKSAYPWVRTGLSGTLHLCLATDFDRICDNNMTYASTYARYEYNPATELMGELMGPEAPCNIWIGYSKTTNPMIASTWSDILCHPCMLSMYSVFSTPPMYWGLLRPDLDVNVPGENMLKSTYKIRNGLGAAMMKSVRQTDPVYVLWYYPAVWAYRIEGGETFKKADLSYVGLLRTLNQLGIRYKFISGRKLEEGKASLDKGKILLLPRADALSDNLVYQIRKFAKAGGVVIADVRPGVFGGELETLSAGKLDREFGIKRSSQGICKSATLNMTGAEKNMFDLDQTVTLTTGKAKFHSPENIPAWIENNYGKGKFVLLNFLFSSIPDLEGKFLNGSGREFVDLFSSVTPVSRCYRNGKSAYYFRNVFWQNGDMGMLFLHDNVWKTSGQNYVCELTGGAKYVFDGQSGRHWEKTKRFEFISKSPAANWFILTDEKLPDLKLTVQGAIRKGQSIRVCFAVDGSMKGLRPALLNVKYNGKENLLFRQSVQVEPQEKFVPYQIAFNEKPGIYTFELKDILTDKIYQAKIEVKQ